MMKNIIFLLLLWIPLALCAQEESKTAEQFVRELDQKIPRLLTDFTVPGAAIAIIENGEVMPEASLTSVATDPVR